MEYSRAREYVEATIECRAALEAWNADFARLRYTQWPAAWADAMLAHEAE